MICITRTPVLQAFHSYYGPRRFILERFRKWFITMISKCMYSKHLQTSDMPVAGSLPFVSTWFLADFQPSGTCGPHPRCTWHWSPNSRHQQGPEERRWKGGRCLDAPTVWLCNVEVSIHGGTPLPPIAGWFISWKVLLKWMITGGTTISGNFHIWIWIPKQNWPSVSPRYPKDGHCSYLH